MSPEAPGEALWSDTFSVSLDSNGTYGIVLGEPPQKPLDASVFNGPDRFLGIQIDGNSELRPRLRLGSTPYAFVAGNALALDGLSLADLDERYARNGDSWLAVSTTPEPQPGSAALTGTLSAGEFVGNGARLTDVEAVRLSADCVGCVQVPQLAHTNGMVTGLNADLVDGLHAEELVALAQKNATTVSTAAPLPADCTEDAAGRLHFVGGAAGALFVCTGSNWQPPPAARRK